MNFFNENEKTKKGKRSLFPSSRLFSSFPSSSQSAKMEPEYAQPPPPCKLHAFVREEMMGEAEKGQHYGGGGNGAPQAEAAPAVVAPLTPLAAVAAAASGSVPTAVASKKAARVAVSVTAAASAAALAYRDIRAGLVAVADKEGALEMAQT